MYLHVVLILNPTRLLRYIKEPIGHDILDILYLTVPSPVGQLPRTKPRLKDHKQINRRMEVKLPAHSGNYAIFQCYMARRDQVVEVLLDGRTGDVVSI